MHQYTNPLNIYNAIRLYQRAMDLYGVSKPIWVGESNVVPDDDPMNPIAPAFHATMDQQASYIIQAFALARAAGAERMSIYKLVDEAREGANELYGLVRNDGRSSGVHRVSNRGQVHEQADSAVYTWDGASEVPTEDQVTALLQNDAKRTQWIWPAAVNRVTLERGTERDMIVWNASPKLVTAKIPAAAKSAQVIDKFGARHGRGGRPERLVFAGPVSVVGQYGPARSVGVPGRWRPAHPGGKGGAAADRGRRADPGGVAAGCQRHSGQHHGRPAAARHHNTGAVPLGPDGAAVRVVDGGPTNLVFDAAPSAC